MPGINEALSADVFMNFPNDADVPTTLKMAGQLATQAVTFGHSL